MVHSAKDIGDLGQIRMGSAQAGRQMQVGWGRSKWTIFDQYLAISQKRCKTGTLLL